MWRDLRFVRLLVATSASGVATWALPFMLGLAVLDRSLAVGQLGVALAARTAGFVLAVPVGGVLADRYSRRNVARVAGWAAAAASPLAAAGLARSAVLPLVVAMVVLGAGQGACRPAFHALTAEVVSAGELRRANAAITMAVRVSSLAAPGATALLATVAPPWTLVAGTGLLWALTALAPPSPAPHLPTRPPAPPPAPPPPSTSHPQKPASPQVPPSDGVVSSAKAPRSSRSGSSRRVGRWVGGLAGEFGEGVREARGHPWFVAGLAALTAVIATGYAATGVVLPLVSRDRYASGAVLLGALTAYTGGAVAGVVLIARWNPRAQGWVALAGLASYGLAPLAMLLPVPATVVVVAYAVAGLGVELFNVPWFTATQREVDPRLLARVSSLDLLLSYGLAPVGLALIAPAMAAFGREAVLAGCAAVCFLAPTAAALTPGTRTFTRTTPPELSGARHSARVRDARPACRRPMAARAASAGSPARGQREAPQDRECSTWMVARA